MTGYKPLTPNFRQEINEGFEKTIAELRSCKNSPFVSVQIEGLRIYQRLINGLPDGYPIPIQNRK